MEYIYDISMKYIINYICDIIYIIIEEKLFSALLVGFSALLVRFSALFSLSVFFGNSRFPLSSSANSVFVSWHRVYICILKFIANKIINY